MKTKAEISAEIAALELKLAARPLAAKRLREIIESQGEVANSECKKASIKIGLAMFEGRTSDELLPDVITLQRSISLRDASAELLANMGEIESAWAKNTEFTLANLREERDILIT